MIKTLFISNMCDHLEAEGERKYKDKNIRTHDTRGYHIHTMVSVATSEMEAMHVPYSHMIIFCLSN